MGAHVDLMDTSHRKEYSKGRLDLPDLALNPLDQFTLWLEEAIKTPGILEPNAMAFATVGEGGRPSCRMVLMKQYDERGFVFGTSYESRKGREVAENGRAALLFYWDELERQVRIEGAVVQTSAEESDALFNARPPGSRLAARASAQSAPIASRALLEEALRQEAGLFSGEEIDRPSKWGGYRIVPDLYEFWQGGVNRLHDRFEYKRVAESWEIGRLQP